MELSNIKLNKGDVLMKGVLEELNPQSVFKNFETITRIPRGSGNEKAVSDFLVGFAKENNLEVIQDDVLNVIIKKPGTPGYENSKGVILQGHMDIVCVKKEDFEFDFEKDAIPLVVDGDMIKTKGTTLGADNGIAVAMAMAILESKDLEHPPLTALITVAEETGMDGVLKLDGNNVKGETLINIDSEDEGVFLASCAGGVNNIVSLPIKWSKNKKNLDSFELTVCGLLGGHSGIEINKNRASAIKLMGRLLQTLNEQIGIDVASISGGEKMNAIPKLTKAIILIEANKFEKLQNIVNEYIQLFSSEFASTDPNITITLEKVNNIKQIFSLDTKKNLINILMVLPFGVQTMSANIKGLVESSNNIGVLETKDDKIIFTSAVRSSVRSLKDEINNRVKSLCDLTGATMELVADYPEWEFKVDSPIRDLMLKVYKDMYNKEAKVDAIHAGLECGFLKEKVGDIDMVSIGPNVYDVHTPEEHLSISSTKRVYKFLCEVLKNIK